MPTTHQSNLQSAAQKARAKTAIDFELFEHLLHHRDVMRAAASEEKDGLDEVAHNMVRIYDLVLKYGRFFEPSRRPEKHKPGDRHQCYGNSCDLVVAHDELPPKHFDVLLMEGTTIGRVGTEKGFPTGEELKDRFVELFHQTKGMPLVWCSGQNIDRIVTIFRACKKVGRQFIIDMYTA